MILSDKQSLRKCVKQLVRHAEIIDTAVFNPFEDDFGLEPMLKSFPGGVQLAGSDRMTAVPDDAGQIAGPNRLTPVSEGAVALYAAFDALGISLSNFEEAAAQAASYTREAWLREILDAMPAKRVLVEVPMNGQQSPVDMDNRFVPLLRVEPEQVHAGRYGFNLETEAGHIYEACVRLGTRQIKLNGYREDFLKYCLLPLSEDRNCILHISLDTARDAARILHLIRQFPAAHCVLYPSKEAEQTLIHGAQGMPRVLISVRTPENMDLAFSCLGFSFMPNAGFSVLPEQMLGRWIINREALHDVLSERYTLLARAGYELTSEAIEEDINYLFTGNFMAFCGIEQ